MIKKTVKNSVLLFNTLVAILIIVSPNLEANSLDFVSLALYFAALVWLALFAVANSHERRG